jgi:uncharacterized protein (UPF0276 family)
MDILRTIHDAATREHKPFLLIGGHALNIHGISRSTSDVDLMVVLDDAAFWRELLGRLGYDVFNETSSFMQSKPTSLTAWPVDLMLVNKGTITKALQDATTTSVFGPPLAVASVGSLIAMKLHALKYVDAVRALKDKADLFALLDLAGIAVNSEGFRQLCAQYGTLEIYERLREIKK